MWHLRHRCVANPPLMQLSTVAGAGLFDNVLSDYLWARAVLLIGKKSPLPPCAPKPLLLHLSRVIDTSWRLV